MRRKPRRLNLPKINQLASLGAECVGAALCIGATARVSLTLALLLAGVLLILAAQFMSGETR